MESLVMPDTHSYVAHVRLQRRIIHPSDNLVGLLQGAFGNEAHVQDGMPEPQAETGISNHALMAYQLMFAIIAPAIMAGAVLHSIKYVWFVLFCIMWHFFVYCPLAHYMFYSDGWLFQYGVLDYAGGLVVHASSGVSSVVLAFWLGRHERARPYKPHNAANVLLGTYLSLSGLQSL
jgi:Amt family ammonium transporter